jgi:hypothetical protein
MPSDPLKTTSNMPDRLAVDVVVTKGKVTAVYINNHRVAGIKPFVAERGAWHQLTTNKAALLAAIGEGHGND